jgi:hypothetical protein
VGTARLEKAIAAYREAALTREFATLDWAMIKNNLGNV